MIVFYTTMFYSKRACSKVCTIPLSENIKLSDHQVSDVIPYTNLVHPIQNIPLQLLKLERDFTSEENFRKFLATFNF